MFLLVADARLLFNCFFKIGNTTEETKYRSLATARGDAIQEVLWDASKSMWRDYDTQPGKEGRRADFYVSHITPLFTRCSGSKVDITSTAFMKQLLASDDVSLKTEMLRL